MADSSEGTASSKTTKKKTRKRTTKKVAPADVANLGASPTKKGAEAKPASKKKTSKKVSKKAASSAESKGDAGASAKTESSGSGQSAGQASGQSSGGQSSGQTLGQHSGGQSSNQQSSGGGGGGGGQKGGAPDLRARQQQDNQNRQHRKGGHQHGHPHQGHQGQQGQGGQNRRNKNKKRKNRPGGPGGQGPSGIPASVLPSDDDLAADYQELAELLGSPEEFEAAASEAIHIKDLERMPLEELHEFAEREGIEDFHKTPRPELTFQILRKRAEEDTLMFGEGSLQISPEGFGFLRSPEASYLAAPSDVYVSPSQIRRLGLRPGMEVVGLIRPPKEGERFFALIHVQSINGRDPKLARSLQIFEDMTPLHPEERYVLETEPGVIETRVVDLVAPIGRGQRALIVAPPRTGKTVLMQKITKAINENFPEVKIIVLLIDERPEEVTDFRRNTSDSVEVVASTFDENASRHTQVAEMVMEKARRHVEYGDHVVILLDSITRLARAYNAASPNTGKIMSGGIDSNALTRPKKFFGSARAIENGGSLTILGTALVDTGSKADEVIFEEFKGTGNSELHLDRKLVEKRIYPAIDVAASGTRREELLLDPKELELVYRLRKVLSDMNVVEAMELLKGRLGKTKTNAEFLMTMNLG
jgi:transcription termination factor Rho